MRAKRQLSVAVLAEKERVLISPRTNAALAAAKARGGLLLRNLTSDPISPLANPCCNSVLACLGFNRKNHVSAFSDFCNSVGMRWSYSIPPTCRLPIIR